MPAAQGTLKVAGGASKPPGFMSDRTKRSDLLTGGEAVLRGAMRDKCYKHHYNRNGLTAHERKYGAIEVCTTSARYPVAADRRHPQDAAGRPDVMTCGCPIDVCMLDVMAYKGQPESREDPQLASYHLLTDDKAFTGFNVDSRRSYLRLLLNSTKSTLDELLRPPIARKCNIITNLLASLHADLEAENESDLAQSVEQMETSFNLTAQAVLWKLHLAPDSEV